MQYINAVFWRTFANEIPAEQIALSPKRDELTGKPAVLRWRLKT